ncbi:hypothetical protein ACP275_04G196400 [Erythranthe tilingii]
MNDEVEKSCPLCAEEMDLTDQQLKPCKCGYEICVWCWHHIMGMAEKDDTEGRCPACRTPYNKEKIVGTTAKCERLMSEMTVEKKLKSHKGKSKTSEGRKQLGDVRVIQRTLVYVVGLPLNFADEDVLHRRAYFGQYGKVLKVSISRTASGAIQHFANSTCSVYITYSKEEEAVRCIQLVHGFVLDGRPLRACFGTTKYCHAWLKNMPCGNHDCLYLHEIGSQEDSFTKDEIVSAYTRVQQITGSANAAQPRSGNVLPPPAEDYCNNTSASSAKPITKTAINTNNSATSPGVSPPNSSSGRSAALPAGASWGSRPFTNQHFSTSMPCFNGPSNQKPEICNGPSTFSKAIAGENQVSSWQSDTGKKKVLKEGSTHSQEKHRTETFEPVKKETKTVGRITIPECSTVSVHLPKGPLIKQPHSAPTTKAPSDTSSTVDSATTSSGPASDRDSIDDLDGDMENLCSNILSTSIHENQQLQNGYAEHFREPVICRTSGKTSNSTEVCDASVQSEHRLGMPAQATPINLHEDDGDLLSFDNQRVNDREIATNRAPDYPHLFNSSNYSNIHSPEFNKAGGLVSIDFGKKVVDRNSNSMVPTSNFPGGHLENMRNNQDGNDAECFNVFPCKEKRSLVGRYEGGVGFGAVDMGESSIISNILSMEFDSWDESLTSPQNLAKLLGETDKQQGSFGVPGSRKNQNSSQSRFSFAREDENMNHVSNYAQSIDYYGQARMQPLSGQDFSSGNSLHHEKSLSRNGLPLPGGAEPDIFANNHSYISSNKLSVSRSQISAPPGFSVPSRAPPPPGFTSQERTEQVYESLSNGNHFLESSSLFRNQYETPSNGNTFSNGDIEFMDPAILAVGKGTFPGIDTRSSFSPHLGTYEDSRFQSFLQRSLPSPQNQRYTDLGESFSPNGDAYRIPSRIIEQNLSSNHSPFSQFTIPHSRNGITSNGQWHDGWNEAQSGNNLGERSGYSNYYGGYEDSKIRMPSSGNNLYNRTYGI